MLGRLFFISNRIYICAKYVLITGFNIIALNVKGQCFFVVAVVVVVVVLFYFLFIFCCPMLLFA